MKLKDILKIAAPVVAGPMVGGMFTGMNPILGSALASGLGAIAFGQKPKDALRSAVLGGLGGAMFGGPQQAAQASVSPSVAGMNPAIQKRVTDEAAARAGTGTATGIKAAIKGGAPDATAKTMSGELLKSVGFAGQDEGNLLFKLLNTNLGEGLAAGLVAQLLAGEDEDEGPGKGSYEQRPYGAGGPGGQLGGMRFADGGLADAPNFYPRRNGGIDPSEGSGTKDDVPALLMAGGFVMTRDAVKGAGGGSLKKGIDNMYTMMDNFERMA